MSIDFEHFTPWLSLLGGLLIGVATTLLLLGFGKIAGVSGIIGGILQRPSKASLWRFLFILGLISASIVAQLFYHLPAIQIDASWIVIIIAGVLVGYGTSLSHGCTSGHGVCGLSRLSLRSAVATSIFMLSAIATVYIVKHYFGR